MTEGAMVSPQDSDDDAEEAKSPNRLDPNNIDSPCMRRRSISHAPEDPAGRTAVWSAVEVSRELRAAGEYLWDFAVRGDHKGLVEAAIRAGSQNTALLISSWLSLSEATDSLLIRGTSANVTDKKGRTPLHLACCAGADECVKLLLHSGGNHSAIDSTCRVTPLHCAAAFPSAACVKHLLEAGADAGLQQDPGTSPSPLYLAVQSGCAHVVQLLLEAGASPNTTQLFTETPLHVASALGLADCVRLLLQHGADVRVQVGPSRATSLHLAAEDGNADCARMLLDAGADPHARNIRQQTPLHLAALAQSAETSELLLTREADPNSTDTGGHTPLHSAIVKGSRCYECVRLLIEHGADVNMADNYGYTPLHIAALSEFTSCVELLIRHGAHVTARTKGGVSALSFMVRRTPGAFRRFLDRLDNSISLHEHELGDVDCTLKLDFRILVPRTCQGESELLLDFVEVGQRHLLQHPLCQTFLFLKWRQIRKFFLVSLIFHAIFVAIHTWFVMSVYLDPDSDKLLPLSTEIIGYLLIAMNIVLVSKEIFQIIHAKLKYFKRWENCLQWLIVVCVILSTQILWSPGKPPPWQYHIAAYGIFFTWIELMMLVGRFPIFGLYVQMFTTVAGNVAKFLLAYSCLLIAFSLSFAILFPRYPSFQSVLWSLLKTVVMMIGELEFEAIFFNDETPILYNGTAHLLFLGFTLLAAIVLMNLLVGLAVSDIQGLQRSAGLDRLVRQAELVAHIESIVFSRLYGTCLPIGIVTYCHRSALLVTSNYRWAIYIRPNDPRETRIPKDLVEAAYRLVSARRPTIRRKGNSGEFTSIRQVSEYSSSTHAHVDPAVLEQIRGQLDLIIAQVEQRSLSEAAVSQRVTSLSLQVEALRKEINKMGTKTNTTDNFRNLLFVSEPNITKVENKKTITTEGNEVSES